MGRLFDLSYKKSSTSYLIGVQERTYNSKDSHSNNYAWVIKPGKLKRKILRGLNEMYNVFY